MAFTWGVSTAAYQIEGGVTEGGRGRSIWDTFAHEPGRIADGATGDIACDHFHRYQEDVDLMAGLGVDAYRFSVAWPRVQPDGTGPTNPAGVAFYDRLVDALLAKGIDPVVTLFHWDLPQALEEKGGWLSRDTAFRFADYAELVAQALGDRVRLWITLNEPFIHMTLGYATGEHAPGQTLLFGALPVAHHQLLGHGLAVARLRSHSSGAVAITNNYSPVWPVSDGDAEAAAAYHALHNRLFTDPLLGRGYPELGLDPTVVHDGDLDTIATPLDALGVNYYNPTGVRAPSTPDSPLPFEFEPLSGYPTTAFGWPVVPDGLRELLVWLKEEYGDALPPIHVTESGCAYDGIDDPERVSYLDGHIAAVRTAIESGVDVRGFFVWSLLDNFEWAEGYTKRFGLVHVDYDTQLRTPKTSYAWYRDLIRASR
ncbi:GH1 family beta-glucosidase [Phytohabitans kaempferiae]|uniref:Beta-glucosidase n=1 Tax=Phytohabitans kaempferiae TaxID=1620943 RepID=A0ABV6MEM3_9ACTN